MAFGVAFQFFLVHYIEGKKENNQFGCKYYVIGLVQLFELNTIKRFLNFVFTKYYLGHASYSDLDRS